AGRWAGENADRAGLGAGGGRGGLEAAAGGWALVVSNPPYVSSLDGLQPELQHEPEGALLGDGFHETIAHVARTRFLVLEVGDGQADEVARTLRAASYEDVVVTADLAGVDRVVEGRR